MPCIYLLCYLELSLVLLINVIEKLLHVFDHKICDKKIIKAITKALSHKTNVVLTGSKVKEAWANCTVTSLSICICSVTQCVCSSL